MSDGVLPFYLPVKYILKSYCGFDVNFLGGCNVVSHAVCHQCIHFREMSDQCFAHIITRSFVTVESRATLHTLGHTLSLTVWFVNAFFQPVVCFLQSS